MQYLVSDSIGVCGDRAPPSPRFGDAAAPGRRGQVGDGAGELRRRHRIGSEDSCTVSGVSVDNLQQKYDDLGSF